MRGWWTLMLWHTFNDDWNLPPGPPGPPRPRSRLSLPPVRQVIGSHHLLWEPHLSLGVGCHGHCMVWAWSKLYLVLSFRDSVCCNVLIIKGVGSCLGIFCLSLGLFYLWLCPLSMLFETFGSWKARQIQHLGTGTFRLAFCLQVVCCCVLYYM